VASQRIEQGKKRGGLSGAVMRASGAVGAGLNFARMYLLRPRRNELPATVRMQPAW
jgi:magnesium-protoporphyrin IX monomethyl ester (oxidative) cyclase